VRQLTSNLVLSAIILWKPIPTPSMTAKRQAQPIAEFRAALTPPLTAKAPPVKKPAITVYYQHCPKPHFQTCSSAVIQPPHSLRLRDNILALYGSSFFLIPFTAQSKVEKSPPQTPKLPPNTGARALIAVRAPIRLSPYGEFLNPFTPCHTAPPIACEQKAS
jgi:hypothetical protein